MLFPGLIARQIRNWDYTYSGEKTKTELLLNKEILKVSENCPFVLSSMKRNVLPNNKGNQSGSCGINLHLMLSVSSVTNPTFWDIDKSESMVSRTWNGGITKVKKWIPEKSPIETNAFSGVLKKCDKSCCLCIIQLFLV